MMNTEEERQRRVLEWRKNQIHLRKQYADTPAGFQNEVIEEAAVSQWKEDWRIWEEQQQYVLAREYQPWQEFFVGREKELMQISAAIRRGNGDPVILYGIGGTGKRVLACEWAHRHRDDYRHILELKFCHSFCQTICSDDILPVTNLQYSKERYGSMRKYFKKKLGILAERIRDEKTLILIEDCDVLWDRDMEALFALSCDFIVTTRLDPILWGYSDGIPVNALTGEEVWTKFAAFYSQNAELEYQIISKLCFRFQSHPMRMIFEIRKMSGEFVEKEQWEFEETFLARLPLKQREKNALSCLSTMPGYRVSRKLFQTVTGCSDQVLLRLGYFLLVSSRDDERGEEVLCLHPVVAEAVQLFLPPTVLVCKKMIRGFAEYFRDRSEYYTKEENQYCEPYALALLQAFSNPVVYLGESFAELCRFLWLQGYHQEAESYLMRIYENVKCFYGEEKQITRKLAELGERMERLEQ